MRWKKARLAVVLQFQKYSSKGEFIIKWDLIIIGGGPAGLTAGLYASRSGLKTLLFEGIGPGGQAATTEIIENYPGFPDGISGPELMERFYQNAIRFGLDVIWENVCSVDLKSNGNVVSTGNNDYLSNSVIIASGSSPRKLGIPGEKEYIGRGVSYCATCDGALFRGRKVAVIGGGEAAVEEGLFLTGFTDSVVLIHRRDRLRATQNAQNKVLDNPRISFHLNTVAEEILGRGKVEEIRLKSVKKGNTWLEKADGVFIYIGSTPNTAFLQHSVEMDSEGYIVTDEMLATSKPGVFAAGDVRKKYLRQVSTAVGEGALAAMSVVKYLQNI